MRFLIPIAILFSLLTGCGPVRDSEAPQVDPELNARQFLQNGDYIAAADEYLALAERDETNAATYRLKATAAYIEAGDYDQALKILQNTEIGADDSLQDTRQRILNARLNLEFGQPGKAREQLLALPADTIPASLRFAYHDILARAWLADSEYTNALEQRLTASDFANDKQLQQNYDSTWQLLQAIPDEKLDELRLTSDETLRSWLELSSIYRTYRFDPEKLDYAIDSWIQRYPGHPAFTSIVPSIKNRSEQFVERPAKITTIRSPGL